MNVDCESVWSGSVPDTLKRKVPAKVPLKKGVIGHYLPFFVHFTHEADNFSPKKPGEPTPLHPSLDLPLLFLVFRLFRDFAKLFRSYTVVPNWIVSLTILNFVLDHPLYIFSFLGTVKGR